MCITHGQDTVHRRVNSERYSHRVTFFTWNVCSSTEVKYIYRVDGAISPAMTRSSLCTVECMAINEFWQLLERIVIVFARIVCGDNANDITLDASRRCECWMSMWICGNRRAHGRQNGNGQRGRLKFFAIYQDVLWIVVRCERGWYSILL